MLRPGINSLLNQVSEVSWIGSAILVSFGQEITPLCLTQVREDRRVSGSHMSGIHLVVDLIFLSFFIFFEVMHNIISYFKSKIVFLSLTIRIKVTYECNKCGISHF